MSRAAEKALRWGLGAGLLGAALLSTAGCEIAVGPDYPGGAYLDYPPDGYIATTEPFYFDGRASYWYGGRWYYRDGGRWGHYDREPAALRQRRLQGAPSRRNYEPSRGARPAGRSGSGGRR